MGEEEEEEEEGEESGGRGEDSEVRPFGLFDCDSNEIHFCSTSSAAFLMISWAVSAREVRRSWGSTEGGTFGVLTFE